MFAMWRAGRVSSVLLALSLGGLVVACDRPEGLSLKAVRSYPYVDLYASRNVKDWEPMAYRPVLLESTVWVGLQVTAAGDGKDRGR